MTFSTPVDQSVNKLFMRKPTASFSLTTYVDVFNWDYVSTLFGTLLGCILVQTLIVHFNRPRERANGLASIGEKIQGSLAAVLLASTSLDIFLSFKQSHLKRLSGKILFFTIAMFGLLSMSIYNAVLTSTLTGT